MNKGIRIAIIAAFAVLAISALFLFFFLGFGGNGNTSSTSTSTSGGVFDFLKKDRPLTTETKSDQERATSTPETIPANNKLSKVTEREVSAFIPLSNDSVRFIERGTGQIFSVSDKKETLLSSRNIQRALRAEFNKKGNALILGIYDDSGNVSEKIALIDSSASTTTAGNVTFLETGGYGFVFSPDGEEVAQLSKNSENVLLTTFSLKNPNKKNNVFSSSFGDWRLAWPEKNTLVLVSKPSGLVPGGLYLVNKSAKTASRGLGDILGLNATFSSDAKNLIYSSANNQGTFSTYMREVPTGNELISPIRALADKCLWSKKEKRKIYCAATKDVPAGTYPDGWYKGKVSFSDAFYTIWADSTDQEFLFDPNEAGIDIDASSLTLNEKEDALYFIDKKTSSLWRLNLSQ